MVQDFVPDDPNHIEGLPRGHRIDQHVTMDANEMFRVENTVFILFNAGNTVRNVKLASRGAGRSCYAVSSTKMRTCPAVSTISVAKS